MNAGTVLGDVLWLEMATISPLFVDKKGDEVELNENDIPGAKLPKPAEHCTV